MKDIDITLIDNYIPHMELQNTTATVKIPPSDRLAKTAISTFCNIAEEWSLSVDEQLILLGQISKSAFYKWRKTPPEALSNDILERISYVIGIYKALRIIYTEDELAVSWLQRPNRHYVFNGQSPIDRMKAGNVSDLYIVRNFVDGMRSPW